MVEIIENLDAALASRGLPSTMERVQMFGQTVENTLDTVAWYMGMVVDLAMNIGNAMTEAGSFVSDNWGVIAPIIYGVVAALAAYALIAGVVAVINGVSAAAQAVHNAQTAMATGATFAYTASQYGLNAALLACPLTWIILLISCFSSSNSAGVCAYCKDGWHGTNQRLEYFVGLLMSVYNILKILDWQ